MPFFEKCPWEGPVEVELIIDERDSKPKIIEINPRLAGSLAFAIQSGINFPHIVCMAAVNEYAAEIINNYNAGMFYINLIYYLKSLFEEFNLAKNKAAYLIQILKELKRKKVGILSNKKDFPVFLAKALTGLKHN